MKNRKKAKRSILAALSLATLAWSFGAGSASAEIEGYVGKTGTKLYYYSVDNLITSNVDYMIDPKSIGSKLWQHFTASQLVAVYDSRRGYIDYKDVLSAYSSSRNLKEYTENTAKIYTVPATILEATLASDGSIIDVEKSTGSALDIAVTNVVVLNETTVQVTISNILSATPDSARFIVRANGQLTPVSRVAQVGSDKQKYNLTIPSLDGKEGSLEVNGKTASTAGLDFSYDFKGPTVVSAVGLDQKHMLVTFSEKLLKSAAETVTNYELSQANDAPLQGATSKTPSSAVLQPDGKTVILTTAGVMSNTYNGYKVSVLASGSIQDAKGNRFASTDTRMFTGAGTDNVTTGDTIRLTLN